MPGDEYWIAYYSERDCCLQQFGVDYDPCAGCDNNPDSTGFVYNKELSMDGNTCDLWDINMLAPGDTYYNTECDCCKDENVQTVT
jgi:hypothetical protein